MNYLVPPVVIPMLLFIFSALTEKRSIVERLLAEAKKDLALTMAWTTPQ